MERPPARHWIAPVLVGGVAAAAASGYAYGRARRPRWARPRGEVLRASSLCVRVLGEIGPPIVLLHGLVASGIYWGGAYDALADGHRLVVPDLLGFGRSARPAAGYGPDDHVDAVISCLDELGIDEPATIGAHSLGGLIALRLAAVHPERVEAIVAFGPPIYADSDAARAHVASTSPMGRLFVLPGRAAETACAFVCRHPALAARLTVLTHPALPPGIAADAVRHTWASYSQTLQQVILAAEAASWLDDVHCPVQLVAGDDDRVVDHEYLRWLAGGREQITLVERPGRHDLPLVDPDECIASIAVARATRERYA